MQHQYFLLNKPYGMVSQFKSSHTVRLLGSISLTEGKYHQVRKMLTAVGLKCKRLVRVSIEDLHLGDLPPGEVASIPEAQFFEALKLG
jgi:16S rRNA U516 pseudouridylate synthase RsuA-like enzyme